MDIKDFAHKINGFEYPANQLDALSDEAKENGFLIIYGMSDDLVEVRGLFIDEIDAYNGVKTKVGTCGVTVNAIWRPKDKPNTSWEIKVDCPHETFNIMEDGDIFCIGVVIHKDHLNT